jgi:aminoglycoside phosphotransferase family enzyme/predicted kinase
MDMSCSAPPAGLVAAMMEPIFYPKPPQTVTHKETHISHLFFAGDLVFKLKKPVRFPFLDYRTLAQRRHFLNEELHLNRRLAPSVYIGVMPICHNESGWRLGGWGEPEEYVLVMRRLPERRMLPFLLETQQVTCAMMRELAHILARFHEAAERATSPSYSERVERQWEKNLAELASADMLAAGELERFTRFGAEFFRAHRQLLGQRATGGWVRDVHGDLHCEHICFAPEGVQIFDCIEFDPALRRCDLAAEIAFLLMDLDVRGGSSFANVFIERYLELVADHGQPELWPFFKCQRALVRGKVYALRGPEGIAQAGLYFRYAGRFFWQSRLPFMIVICGLSGSGKSTLARELGFCLGLPVINSDAVRKAMAGVAGPHAVAMGEDIYSPTMTARTYARMAREAEKQVAAKSGAILDATYMQREQRGKLRRLAARHRIPLLFIHCAVSAELTRARLDARTAAGNDISDGRWEIYLQQRVREDPISEVAPEDQLELDTAPPLQALVRQVEDFLDARLTSDAS